MAKPRNKVLDYLQYVGLRLFAMGVHMFSWRANYATARLIGNILYRLDKRHRNRALQHLRLSFPDWPQERYEQVARASVRSLVYLGMEVLLTTRLIKPTSWRRYVKLLQDPEQIRMLTEHRTPIILITGHLGNWEVLGYTLATLGFDCYAVARSLDNPYANEYILGYREKTGLRILDKKGATEQVDGILAAGGVVGFIADQDAGRKGMFVDFFGRKASTYKSIALLAINHKATLIVGYGHRLNEEFSFDFGISCVITPDQWADQDDPVRWITQAYTSGLEEAIRRCPEQYLWVHRRWKHRPKGEEPGPDGIA
ncbi:MAG: hypothetical protein LLG01_06755 [Planctomycetaceae bacterium]|nr:hypothetical protein [Planctomycetaceae bacterium]